MNIMNKIIAYFIIIILVTFLHESNLTIITCLSPIIIQTRMSVMLLNNIVSHIDK